MNNAHVHYNMPRCPGSRRGLVVPAGNCLARRCLAVLGLAAGLVSAPCQVPAVLSYQGRVLVGGAAFSGAGQLKFALVSNDGTQTYWLNSPDLNSDGQPDTSVTLNLSSGLFTVGLGDTNVPGMAALPPGVFTNPAVSLRLWFNDGSHGVQRLGPDQPVTSAGYAMVAGNVVDGAITSTKLSTNAVTTLTAALSAQVNALSAQVSALTTLGNTLSNQYSQSIGSGLTAASANPQDAALGAKGFQLFSALPAPAWVTSTAPGALSPRSSQAGVWTGQQLLLWGGDLGPGAQTDSGALYDPVQDQWQWLTTISAPPARSQHTTIWTGQEMIAWGGQGGGSYLNSGGRFSPSNQAWTVMSASNAPAGRAGQVAIWTGTQMLVWGGRNFLGLLNDGALYNPLNDRWTALAPTNAPSPRSGATGIWTGTRLLVWGGENEQGALNTGGQLLFGTNGLPTAWQTMNSTNALAGRTGHAAVWTGQKLLVWGGQAGNAFLGDGAAYDPVADQWSALSLTNAPTPRAAQSAVWTGQEMLVFGGETASGTVNDGAAYNPVADQWRPLSGGGLPQARSGATAVWSGVELLCFGGLDNGVPLATLQRLNPQPAWYLYRKP